MHDLERFTLGLFQKLGVEPREVASRTYRVKLPLELNRFFRRSELFFTFSEEHYDIHQDEGIEFITAGSPLLDRLIGFVRSRFMVSEAMLQGKALGQLALSSQNLNLEKTPKQLYRKYLCFHVKISVRSDEHLEEILPIWMDLTTKQVLSEAPETPELHPSETPTALAPEEVQEAWNGAWSGIQQQLKHWLEPVQDGINLRLQLEINKRRASGPERQMLIDRFKPQLQTELVFAELLMYPVQLWEVQFKARNWSMRAQYRWDMVRKTWLTAPTCSSCQQITFQLQGCEKGHHLVCERCQQVCKQCQVHQCRQHPLEKCSSCQGGTCNTCLEGCHACQKHNCPTCLMPCPECRKQTCHTCVVSCADCDRVGCTDHFQTCHITLKSLCARHARTCQGCQNVTHHSVLHLTEDGALLCENCAVVCTESHSRPTWLNPAVAMQCSGQHTKPQYLCHQHVQVCTDCGKAMCQQHLVTTKSGVKVCRECAKTCPVCPTGTYHTSQEVQGCQDSHHAAHLVCHEHQRSCHDCKKSTCSHHSYRSKRSHNAFCREHIVVCPDCKTQVGRSEAVQAVEGLYCLECVGKCAACNQTHSRKYLHTAKHSGRTFCKTHIMACPECQTQVGVSEAVQTLEGPRCPDCHDTCKTCHTDHALSGLTVCPSCVPASQKGKNKRDLRLYLHCQLHVHHCHVCSQATCQSHTKQCADCLQNTCPDHLVTDTQGRKLCSKCAVICTYCPSGTYHHRKDITSCSVSKEHLCKNHTLICEDCLKPVGARHTAKCSSCQGLTCRSCLRENECYTCWTLKPADALLLKELGLQEVAQSWSIHASLKDRGNGTFKQVVVYHTRAGSLWGALTSKTSLMLDVYLRSGQKIQKVRHLEPEKAPRGFPNPSRLKALQDALQKRKP
ncbi:hypothetical protein [Deinococcus cellulosilyticus]|uniref:Uncharacterized protein n=1 Tax=Deinococcus cellulosilyticus (strain DSM 18568 / NBRC 106333 / KACC 11606 / 5516J-15) TaxID=1223518 RepID=A0A511N3G9_DEIC1|nr:hypothetical protein [Deinococcus cellulosilyticus]GEM46966.1 hypothetical protein DC3_26010 [Deinococcus cellulosilyticus NBRC 106333 = KACC 11606]